MNKWEQLKEEEKDVFNRFAERKQEFLVWYKRFMELGRCPSCKYRFSGWDEFTFHYSSTHGIPVELIYEMLTSFEEDLKRLSTNQQEQ